jgi:hypothetical protein
MRDFLYLIAVLLIIGWLIGFIGYNIGGYIHLFLVMSVLAILLRIMMGHQHKDGHHTVSKY